MPRIITVGLVPVCNVNAGDEGKGGLPFGIAITPANSLLIENAPASLYRDPIFDGAADPRWSMRNPTATG